MTDKQDNKYKALLLESKGLEAQKVLTIFLGQSDIAPICYACKLRVKPKDKLIEKIQRKLKEKPDYKLEKITDVVGLRLVTLFRHDMADVFQKVVAAIMHINAPNPNPFCKGAIEEIIIYSTNPKYDEIIPAIKDNFLQYGKETDVDIKVEHSGEGYSSIHLVSRLNGEVEGMNKYHIPIEVQIRTVFEDAWGEIDHKYGYVIRTGKEKEIGKPINNQFVLSHLKVLKKFSDACAEYADLIYQEATISTLKKMSSEKIISIGSDDDIIKRFEELNVNQILIDKFLDARKIKEKASEVFNADREKGTKLYMQSAELFREILNDDNGDNGTHDRDMGLYLLRYYIKMNEAICLFTTNLFDNVKKACSIYTQLEGQYDRFPLLKMRLAQSHGMIGYVDLAISKFQEAKELTYSLLEESKGRSIDELPEPDFRHLESLLPRLLGYNFWKKAEEATDKKLKLECLQKAYEETEAVLKVTSIDEKNKLTTHNNLLYYAVEYLNLSEEDNGFTQRIKPNISDHISAIENSIEYPDIEIQDTLAKALYFIRRYDNIANICDQILTQSLDPNNKSVDGEIKLLIAQNAYKLKSKLNTATA